MQGVDVTRKLRANYFPDIVPLRLYFDYSNVVYAKNNSGSQIFTIVYKTEFVL